MERTRRKFRTVLLFVQARNQLIGCLILPKMCSGFSLPFSSPWRGSHLGSSPSFWLARSVPLLCNDYSEENYYSGMVSRWVVVWLVGLKCFWLPLTWRKDTVALKTTANLDCSVGQVWPLPISPGSGHHSCCFKWKLIWVGENPQVDRGITHYHLAYFLVAFNKINVVNMIKLQHGMCFECERWSCRS